MTGINAAGQYDQPFAAWMKSFKLSDLTAMRAAGLKTLRLPINFTMYPPDDIALCCVENIIAAARGVTPKLQVIIDNHVNTAFLADPIGQRQNFLALCGKIATRFASFDNNVMFELLNEPNGSAFSNKFLQQLYADMLAVVRPTNPTRLMLFGGQDWNSVAALATLTLPADHASFGVFHYYTPMRFTHQGATWVIDPATKMPFAMGATWGTIADYKQLADDVAAVAAFIKRTGRMVYMTEFGVVESVPVAQRAAWIKAVKQAFALIGVECVLWGWRNSFTVTNDAGIYQEIVAALA